VQSGPNAIEVVKDLGVVQERFSFAGRFVLKPGRKHRFNFEYIPLRMNGVNDLSRSIEYNGRVYGVQDRISTLSKLNFLSAGYQYDLFSRKQGHFGLEFGSAFLNFDGTVRSLRTELSASEKVNIPLPLLGSEGRVFVIPGSKLLNLHGHVRGTSLGRYGNYIDGGGGVGVTIGSLTVEAGYRRMEIEADNNKSGASSLAARPRFSGLVLGLQFRDR
jgi:hypothetical protein